ncbi:MAG TPA: hypothetical protein DC047_07290 [Blastocatellia bacterium]|nr:hypothetical protein [Blastocatellia bacterium]
MMSLAPVGALLLQVAVPRLVASAKVIALFASSSAVPWKYWIPAPAVGVKFIPGVSFAFASGPNTSAPPLANKQTPAIRIIRYRIILETAFRCASLNIFASPLLVDCSAKAMFANELFLHFLIVCHR